MKYFSPMKNLYWKISFIFILFSVSLSAQNERGFKSGILLGVVPSQVDGDSYGGYNKIGLQAGFFTTFEPNEKMYWQMAIKYMQKGSRNKNLLLGTYYSLNLNYVEIPVSFTYRYKEKFLGDVGMSYGYLIKSMEDKDGYGGSEPYPPMLKHDLEAMIGVGFRFSDHLYIINRLAYSVISIRKYPGGQKYWFNRGWVNNLISIALYYKF